MTMPKESVRFDAPGELVERLKVVCQGHHGLRSVLLRKGMEMVVKEAEAQKRFLEDHKEEIVLDLGGDDE